MFITNEQVASGDEGQVTYYTSKTSKMPMGIKKLCNPNKALLIRPNKNSNALTIEVTMN